MTTNDAWSAGRLDAVAQAELVHSGAVTARELVAWAIERIEALNPTLNAVVTPMFERALEHARRIDSGSAPRGPLAGVPYLVKDLVAEVKGVRFTEGSVFLRDNVSTYTSEIVSRLERAGVVIVGKSNTPEFGMVPACEPVLFGATRNPWDVDRSTSGSSGGSAAAVASGMVPAAHANDLGGSIRYPAAACGLFGLKPTRARVPLGPEYGDAVSGWAVEHAVTRSVRDSAALLDAVQGPMLGDPYLAPAHGGTFAGEVSTPRAPLRIRFTTRTPEGTDGHPDCIAAVESAAKLCAALGHEVDAGDFVGLTPEVGEAIGSVFMAATAWIVDYWVQRLGREPGDDEIEPVTRAYWETGRAVSAGDYLRSIERVQRFTRQVARFFEDVDLWLTPTMSTPPAMIGEITSTRDDPWRSLRTGGPTVQYAGVIANMTGNPAMSLPLSWNGDGLPIGVHFLGRYGDEATLFQLASQLESAQPWADRWPPITPSNAVSS